jgi:hypothetical protein
MKRIGTIAVLPDTIAFAKFTHIAIPVWSFPLSGNLSPNFFLSFLRDEIHLFTSHTLL